MKSDRELLELAAKAAGYDVVWHETVVSRKGRFGLIEHTKKEGFRLNFKQWNPLEEDGDALRLALTLNILVGVGQAWTAGSQQYGAMFDGYPEGELFKATRLAIVRAAAEIGESMP